jgi:hypothetical protein
VRERKKMDKLRKEDFYLKTKNLKIKHTNKNNNNYYYYKLES